MTPIDQPPVDNSCVAPGCEQFDKADATGTTKEMSHVRKSLNEKKAFLQKELAKIETTLDMLDDNPSAEKIIDALVSLGK